MVVPKIIATIPFNFMLFTMPRKSNYAERTACIMDATLKTKVVSYSELSRFFRRKLRTTYGFPRLSPGGFFAHCCLVFIIFLFEKEKDDTRQLRRSEIFFVESCVWRDPIIMGSESETGFLQRLRRIFFSGILKNIPCCLNGAIGRLSRGIYHSRLEFSNGWPSGPVLIHKKTHTHQL